MLFVLAIATCTVVFLRTEYGSHLLKYAKDTVQPSSNAAESTPTGPPHPVYKPTPTYSPPPVTEPFPLLATSTPPPIPEWNQPRENLFQEYDLPVAPPLIIGFTRNWPILLQAVVSYVTAGWPPSQIYVVENTGVHLANAEGRLSLQNPFFLNHTVLGMLGVNVVRTPVLLNFAQLQNFYLSMSYEHEWPYYFWSHQDVVALSFEDGKDGSTPRYNEPGYKTVYELSCSALAEARRNEDGQGGRPRWGLRLFAYDHLALVNPAAYEDIGGWDSMIPYYVTDCDMHDRLRMANWTIANRYAGVIVDISSVLDDLAVLYRVPGISPSFSDQNPPPPEDDKDKRDIRSRRDTVDTLKKVGGNKAGAGDDKNLAAWKDLFRVTDSMFQYKYKNGPRGRNTWQTAQRGGQGEPFYYSWEGFAEGFSVLNEAGKEVYRKKWGHKDCDLIAAGLQIGDQWLVEKDW